MSQACQDGLYVVVEFTDGEIAVMRAAKDQPPSEWAQEHIIIVDGDAAGPYRPEVTPYLPFIMDMWARPWVRKVIVMAAPQGGKTLAEYICMFYSRARQGGRALIVLPDQESVKRMEAERIAPMIQESATLNELMSPRKKDNSRTRKKFINGAAILMSWANSPALLAALPMNEVYLDETDKFKDLAGKETSPIKLAEKRVRRFPYTSKVFMTSSPTLKHGHINQAMENEAQEIYDFHVICPTCGEAQLMKPEQLKVPEGEKDPSTIKYSKLAWYECEHCGAIWKDPERDEAARRGVWLPRLQKIDKPSVVGFHLPAFPYFTVSLSEIAAARLAAESNKASEIDYHNDYLALPYEDIRISREKETMLALRDDRPPDLVPPTNDISCLTFTADTQKRGFYYEIRAWGWGRELTSWLVRCGYVTSFAAMEQVLLANYQDAQGNKHQVVFGLIDAMGDKTVDVYDWCRSVQIRNLVFPAQGVDRANYIYRPTELEYYPGATRKIPGGLRLYRLNVNKIKDKLAEKLHTIKGDPGAWNLHSETPDEYADHFCAEYKNDKGRWVCPSHAGNHFWDTSVYQLAAALIIDVARWEKDTPLPGESPGPAHGAPPSGPQSSASLW